MAMTGAERQQRFRDKIKKQTLDESEKEEQKVRKHIHKMIDRLSTVHIYAIEALLYSITWSYPKEEKNKEIKIKNMCGYSNALRDFDTELCEGDGSLWDELETE